MIAAGAKIDPDKVEKFSVQLDKVYGNPFVRQKREPRTAAEIKEYLKKRSI